MLKLLNILSRHYISQLEKVKIVQESHTSGLSIAEVACIPQVGLSALH